MLDAIKSRRSIRKYKAEEPVSADLIDRLVEAAMYAPSANDRRPWSFVVCTEPELIQRLRAVHPYARMLETAPVCLVVCGDTELAPDYYQQDCAAATQNILLAARGLGLGTCWMGVAPNPARMDPVTELLGLPETVKPFCMIAVGWPDESKPVPDRFDRKKLHYNGW